MSLDPSKLEKYRAAGANFTARCPACAESNGDAKGEHLSINAEGRFCCVLNEGDAGKDHRARIFELAGVKVVREKSEWKALPAAPLNAPFPTLNHFELGTPAKQFTYHTGDGRIAGIVARFETAKGKETRPFVWCEDQHGGKSWQWKAMAAPRTIYNLPLAADAVVIAEGEKAAEAVIAAGYAATTWQGGAGAVSKSDFSPLAGKRVTIWPDNDEPGLKAQRALVSILAPIAAEIRIVAIPDGMPKGWDAADTIAEEIRRLVDSAEVMEKPEHHEPEADEWEIPPDVFPVPAGGIAFTKAAEIIFPAMGEKRRLFMRSRTPHEIAADGDESDFLLPVSPERFCNLIEGFSKRVARRETGTGEMKGKAVWRSCTFPAHSAKILLLSDEATKHLPPIRQLTNCPILTPSGEVLAQGYHDHGGGTFVGKGKAIPAIPLAAATTALLGLLDDFDFPTVADHSRAFASLISPALKMGGWIHDDFPLDLAEADQSQSGKTYRQKLVCRIYAETPQSITISRGGVGSVDEAISTALIGGRPFITLGNIRGRIDSAILEEAIRGAGRIQCRALKMTAEVDCRPFLWQLSTNGAELTRDLANRAIVTRIRKQPADYRFRHFPEGDLEAHIVASQPFYLGCVFAILREWLAHGKPCTDENRHDFRGWCRGMDGIIQMLGLAPLLDGHREQQDRTANPALQWLREILLAARPSDHGHELNAGALLTIAEDAEIELPGSKFSKDDPAIRAGRILGKIFREAEAEMITVDGFNFERIEAPDYSESGRGRTTKRYVITRP